MDRRHFSKLSALAAAATTLPAWAQNAVPNGRKIGFAAVGLGEISDIFIRAVGSSQKCAITGLVSGHADQKAPKYTGQLNIPQSSVYTYDTFDRIADNKAIDAVYIGLPNSLHAEYTIRAAKAGKHVLCEKPMALNSDECRAMIKACRDHNVKLMIAYRIHYDPMFLRIRDMARSGALGPIQGFQGGFYGPGIKGWRLDRKFAGGGSLYDLGVYPLNTIRWIAGEEPTSFTAQVSTPNPGPRYSSMEETVEWTMTFPSKRIASSGSSYGASGPNFVSIAGTEAFLRVEPAYSYNGLSYTVHKGDRIISQETNTEQGPYQFTLEADHLADCIHNNTTPNTPGEEGLADHLAIEAIYEAAGHPVS